MTKFKDKYRVESNRLKGWDYSSPGYYFVTIVTQNRTAWFGEVVDAKMVLSPVGEIVAEEWRKTAIIRSNVELDAWVIMPNHIHGIIVIVPGIVETPRAVETPRRGVSTGVDQTSFGDYPRGASKSNNPSWKPNSLGSIINQFKSVCTKRIRSAGYADFGWQSRYYDHIVRDEKTLLKIRHYIDNNPKQWELDDYHILTGV